MAAIGFLNGPGGGDDGSVAMNAHLLVARLDRGHHHGPVRQIIEIGLARHLLPDGAGVDELVREQRRKMPSVVRLIDLHPATLYRENVLRNAHIASFAIGTAREGAS